MTNEELVILIQQGDRERIAELYQQNIKMRKSHMVLLHMKKKKIYCKLLFSGLCVQLNYGNRMQAHCFYHMQHTG